MKIPKHFNKAGSKDYIKQHARGYCNGFSLVVINEGLGQGKSITMDKVPL